VTREEWLLKGSEFLAALIEAKAGIKVPSFCVSVGFPKGTSGRRKAIGQCWSTEVAEDGKAHIFVSPELGEPTRVLDVLLHEMIHAGTPKAKHSGAFIAACKAVGLVRPWTATTASQELQVKLEEIVTSIGPFPHGALKPTELPRKGSTLKLYQCECGVKVRIGKSEFDATCNLCGSTFELQDK
jgi:hypothetical protein